MSVPDEPYDPKDPSRFRPSDPKTQQEVGGVLERAFQREGGREPEELEAQRFLALAEEADQRAEAAESLAMEAEDAAAQASERFARTGGPDDLESVKRYEDMAGEYRREAECMRLEAERLRKYLP